MAKHNMQVVLPYISLLNETLKDKDEGVAMCDHIETSEDLLSALYIFKQVNLLFIENSHKIMNNFLSAI